MRWRARRPKRYLWTGWRPTRWTKSASSPVSPTANVSDELLLMRAIYERIAKLMRYLLIAVALSVCLPSFADKVLFDNSYSYLTTKKIRYAVYMTDPIDDVPDDMWVRRNRRQTRRRGPGNKLLTGIGLGCFVAAGLWGTLRSSPGLEFYRNGGFKCIQWFVILAWYH